MAEWRWKRHVNLAENKLNSIVYNEEGESKTKVTNREMWNETQRRPAPNHERKKNEETYIEMNLIRYLVHRRNMKTRVHNAINFHGILEFIYAKWARASVFCCLSFRWASVSVSAPAAIAWGCYLFRAFIRFLSFVFFNLFATSYFSSLLTRAASSFSDCAVPNGIARNDEKPLIIFRIAAKAKVSIGSGGEREKHTERRIHSSGGWTHTNTNK